MGKKPETEEVAVGAVSQAVPQGVVQAVPPPKQLPTVGRIVLFNHDGKNVAGIVTEVYYSTTVALRLQLPPSLNHLSDAQIESCVEGTGPGTWSWPPRT